MVLRVAGCMLMLSSCANAESSQEDSGMLQLHKMGDSAHEDCSKGGCKPGAKICCKAMTAECLSCSAGSSVEEFCSANPTTSGCPKICCQAMTAQCLSCSADSTEEEFCSVNPTTTGCPKKWTLLARQTVPFLFKKNQWELNADKPDGDNYAILDKWAEFKQKNGTYRLKLEWPKNNLKTQEWEQTSNPVQDCKTTNKVWGAKGYSNVANVPYTSNGWGGLECGGQTYSLLDGTVSQGNWFYAVGSFMQYANGYPGPSSGQLVKQVELWVQTER